MPAKLTLAPHILWVQDKTQVLIVDEQHHKNQVLTGIEAAIWSWLSLGYSFAKLVKLTAAALDTTKTEAEPYLVAVIQKWYGAGLLDG